MSDREDQRRIKRYAHALNQARKEFALVEPKYLALQKLIHGLEQLIALDAPVCEIEVKPDVVEMLATGKAKGGERRAEVLTPERRSEIARMGADARWKTSGNPAEVVSPPTQEQSGERTK